MNNSSYPLLDALTDPEQLRELSLAEWNELIPQARHALLLGRLHALILQYDLLEILPEQPLNHTLSAYLASEKQRSTTLWEVIKLGRALNSLDVPVVLLKGGAYIQAELSMSNGRLLSDIDILVPREELEDIEKNLHSRGWRSSKKDDYDDRYYREWMHEIPPLKHITRGSFLDVHHTILPPTAKYKPAPEKLLEAAREISPGIYTLGPVDMVIHSATHLFHEGDFDHGLRDILDLHGLLNHFGESETGFWDELVPRALELDLINPLYYALHYCSLILETNIPEVVLQQAEKGKPNPLMSWVMDWLFMRALRPDHPSCDLPFTGLARWLLYIRSHYLRMPLRLLIPHLIRKAWKRQFAETVEQAKAGDTPIMQKTKIRGWRFWAR
jgi:Uncharacterised nucleotidyltransferase